MLVDLRMTSQADYSALCVRPAAIDDIPALLPLMRGLAEYEGYADRFAVTAEMLEEQGFHRVPPDFECLVAEAGDRTLAGMLIYYLIPFTFTGRPTFYIKELYVAAAGRGLGVGGQLMRAAAVEAVRRNCGQMKWQVARWNIAAAAFYTRLGALSDPEWVDYALAAPALSALAESALP